MLCDNYERNNSFNPPIRNRFHTYVDTMEEEDVDNIKSEENYYKVD